jgi:hypothetical protein
LHSNGAIELPLFTRLAADEGLLDERTEKEGCKGLLQIAEEENALGEGRYPPLLSV